MPVKNRNRVTRHRRLAIVALVLSACAAKQPPSPASAVSEEEAISRIAADIERVSDEFPQLAEFSAKTHCDSTRLVIQYGFHTHRARGRGGWTSGVPNPDDDGVWFWIDFHDPSSSAQIHTQPVVAPLWFRHKKVMLLMLEGKKTKKLGATLQRILEENGVTRGPRDD